MSVLPFPEAERLDPFATLDQRSSHLASLLSGEGPRRTRRDVLRRRAQILLLLLDMRCPRAARPYVSWYVPGAVARVGASGIVSRWEARWEEEAPSERTIRRHLAALQAVGAIVTSPRDWKLGSRDPAPMGMRDRHRDTIHVLETDEETRWWASQGRARLAQREDAAWNPDAWWMLFREWRREAARWADAGELAELTVEQEAEESPCVTSRAKLEPEECARELKDAAFDDDLTAPELLAACERAGAPVHGKHCWVLASHPGRLRTAMAQLAEKLRRGGRLDNPSGWLVRTWKGLRPSGSRSRRSVGGSLRHESNTPGRWSPGATTSVQEAS